MSADKSITINFFDINGEYQENVPVKVEDMFLFLDCPMRIIDQYISENFLQDVKKEAEDQFIIKYKFSYEIQKRLFISIECDIINNFSVSHSGTLYSNGYINSTTYTDNGAWMIYRNTNGDILLNGTIYHTSPADCTNATNGGTAIDTNLVYQVDTNDNGIFRLRSQQNSDGKVIGQFIVRNYVTSSSSWGYWRGLGITVDKAGTVTWAVDGAASFRSAIGVDASATLSTDATANGYGVTVECYKRGWWVQIYVHGVTSAALTAEQQICTIPQKYYPRQTQWFVAANVDDKTVNRCSVATNGNVKFNQAVAKSKIVCGSFCYIAATYN